MLSEKARNHFIESLELDKYLKTSLEIDRACVLISHFLRKNINVSGNKRLLIRNILFSNPSNIGEAMAVLYATFYPLMMSMFDDVEFANTCSSKKNIISCLEENVFQEIRKEAIHKYHRLKAENVVCQPVVECGYETLPNMKRTSSETLSLTNSNKDEQSNSENLVAEERTIQVLHPKKKLQDQLIAINETFLPKEKMAMSIPSEFAERFMNFMVSGFSDLKESLSNNFNTINSNVKNLNETVNVMKTDINDLKGSFTVMNDDINDLKKTVDTIKHDNIAMKSDINDLKGSVNDLKSEVSDLKISFNVIKKTVDTIKNDNIAMKSDINDLKKTVDTIKHDNIAMKSDINDLKKTVDIIKNDNIAMKSDIKGIAKNIGCLYEKIVMTELEKSIQNSQSFHLIS